MACMGKGDGIVNIVGPIGTVGDTVAVVARCAIVEVHRGLWLDCREVEGARVKKLIP